MQDLAYVFHGFTAAPAVYDNRLWAHVLSCPMGDALDADGVPLFERHRLGIRAVFERLGGTHLSGVAFTKEAMCPAGPFSEGIQTKNGDHIDLRDFHVIVIACHWAYHEFIVWLRKRRPDALLVGIHDDSLQEMEYCDPALQSIIIQSLSCLDGFIAYNHQMLKWVSVLAPQAEYWRHPISHEFLARVKPRSVRKRDAVCLGISNWNYDFANFITSVAVLKRIKEHYPHLQGEFMGIREYRAPFMGAYQECVEDVSTLGWRTEDYYEKLAQYKIILQMNSRAVAGRVSAEAAAVGTPVVGNRVCDMQEYCWPELSVSEFDACSAFSLTRKVLDDEEWRAYLIDQAWLRVQELAEETCSYKERFQGYVRRLDYDRRR